MTAAPASRESAGARAWRRFLRHRPATIGLVVLVVMGVLALLAPWLSPYDPRAQDIALLGQPQPPSWAHPMGTDVLGRDMLARILFGARVSLAVGLLSAAMAAAIGTLIGAVAGYYRGLTDDLLMRFVDLMLSIPILPITILLAGILRPSVGLIVVIIGTFGWMGTARLVRSRFLSLRESEFVEASRALGAGAARIIVLHILPNALGPVVVATTLAVGGAIMLESALSFLGLGVQPPTPTWGNLLNEARQWLATAPWMAIFPGTLILITVLAVNFLGDGLRDALDPKS
jgi:peptide/nickel transport system permease protein